MFVPVASWFSRKIVFSTNEIVNDVVVVTIGIFGKSLNYRGEFAQNFILVLIFTHLLNFKWPSEFVV